MSNFTDFFQSASGGGGGPVNSIVRLFVGDELQYTDENGGVYLKTGNFILENEIEYPNAYTQPYLGLSEFAESFSVATQDTSPYGLVFNNDGTKMYFVGTTNDSVYEYTLGTAFNIVTAVFVQSFSVAAQDTVPTGLAFNNDGTKMYVLGNTNKSVYEYTLGTAFNISTASFVQSFSVGNQDASPLGLAFNNDGTKMYVLGSGSDVIIEYGLGTAFNIATAVFVQSFSIAAQDAFPVDLAFNNAGTKMYFSGNGSKSIYEYDLSTAFNISTAVFTVSFSVVADDALTGLAFNNDGTKMYTAGRVNDSVYEYTIPGIMGDPTDTGDNDYLKLK